MDQVLAHLRENREIYLKELTDYLAIPSVSSDPEREAELQRCAEFTADLLRRAGMENVAVRPTAGHPVVTGDRLHAPGSPTFLIYGHYDVQPVDPIELWERDPFEAHVKNNRLVARGSADDKGQIFMHIKAVEAFHKVEGRLPVNVKFIIEGEEEVASPSLPSFLRENKDALAADVVLVSDTQMHGENMPSIVYGLRGLTYLEVKLNGPNRDLHSGEYGGAVGNPAEILARLIASAKDADGRIQIPGFYDKVVELPAEERQTLGNIPYDDAKYKADLGVDELWGEKGYSTHEHTWIRPSFEVNGIWGGFTEAGQKTVLPASASAKISTRLVPNQDPDEIAGLVEEFFRENAPCSVKVEVKRYAGGHQVVTPLDNPFMEASRQALRETFNKEPLMVRGGGSIPIVADFKKVLGLDTILMGFCLPDCRAHSPNENMHIPSMFAGMESIARVMNICARNG